LTFGKEGAEAFGTSTLDKKQKLSTDSNDTQDHQLRFRYLSGEL
jgi:hypothetical protein